MSSQSRLAEKLEDVTAILVLGAGLLALILGYDKWWAILALGWLVLVPLVDEVGDLVVEWRSERRSNASRTSEDAEPSALTTLQERYARGEIDDLEFERRLERLLETETVDEARPPAEYESFER